MPSGFPNYRGSASIGIAGDGFGGYVVTVNTYEYDNLVSTNTYNFDGGSDEIVGIYQRMFPDDYATVVDFPSSTNPDLFDVTAVGGLKLFAANCTSLVHVGLSEWKLPSTGVYHNEYGFYNCPQLYMVLCNGLNDAGESNVNYFDSVHYSAHMFEGDANLHYITTTSSTDAAAENSVVISFENCLGYNKDMFKGCTSLEALKLRNGTGVNDLTAQQTFDGVVYEHGYEYIGLTTEQFNNIVTLVTD